MQIVEVDWCAEKPNWLTHKPVQEHTKIPVDQYNFRVFSIDVLF
jgi:hypothetical protein